MKTRPDASPFFVFERTRNSDIEYLSGYDQGDYEAGCLYVDGSVVLLVKSGLEIPRVRRETRADAVHAMGEFDLLERVSADGPEAAIAGTVDEFLQEYDVDSFTTPSYVSYTLLDALQQQGYDVDVEYDPLGGPRALKSREEIERIRASQEINEHAMEAVVNVLEASVVEDGTLHHDGRPLTSADVRAVVHSTVARHGARHPEDPIVACGSDGADPTNAGSGKLHAGEPIMVDLSAKYDGYYADITRTFVKGEAAEETMDAYEATRTAQEAAFAVLEDGSEVSGAEVDEAVRDSYARSGYETDPDGTPPSGFLTATGHGLGVELHEYPPGVFPGGGPLDAGNVVTIEPGLYYPDLGGVRIEDTVAVTESGVENLTSFPKFLTV